MADDARLNAARYRFRALGLDDDADGAVGETPARSTDSDVERAGQASAAELERNAAARAAYVEQSIQQAIRRGDFDDLPGPGKPLEGLGDRYDPDWWIRRKIEREQLSGLAPPALALRAENAELDARLDRLHREQDVRDAVEEFNGRIVEARRQLLGGPPVVTPTRDVDQEVRAWRQRRDERRRLAEERQGVERRQPEESAWEKLSDAEQAAAMEGYEAFGERHGPAVSPVVALNRAVPIRLAEARAA